MDFEGLSEGPASDVSSPLYAASFAGSAACSTSWTDILPLLPEGVIEETSISSSRATSHAFGEILTSSGGDEGNSLLEEEVLLNPFMNFDNGNYIKEIGLENVNDYENFKKIRVMKDEF